MVRLMRRHLGMDIAFVSEISEQTRELKIVDTDEVNCPVQPGLCTPMEETYCRRIIEGELPELMPDIRDFPLASAMPVTAALNIGSYVSAPIRLADGSVYGTFCCYSHAPDPSLNERDLAMMHVCADMTARQIDKERQETRKRKEIEERLRPMLSGERMSIVYQPIYDLARDRVTGFEALSRFDATPPLSPDRFFHDAHSVGMGSALEAKAIQLGLQALQHFPSDVYVSVNISPEALLSSDLQQLFDGVELQRVTLEITEHAAIEQYEELDAILRPLRARGVHLAVDDAGAGYASFRHILQLEPDRIKLDCSLTKQVDSDPTRRALIAAFVRFSEDTGAKLIAEGVETTSELQALRSLGVAKAQGFFLCRPLPLEQALTLLH